MSESHMTYFEPNPEKAKSRITINSALIGLLLTVFGVVWSLNPERLTTLILVQIAFAIPSLFVSSLCYSKVAYRRQVRYWDIYGWFTHNIGLIFTLNLVGIMVYTLGFKLLSSSYFLFLWILMFFYSLIDIHYDRKVISEKVFKTAFFISVQLVFAVIPLYFSH